MHCLLVRYNACAICLVVSERSDLGLTSWNMDLDFVHCRKLFAVSMRKLTTCRFDIFSLTDLGGFKLLIVRRMELEKTGKGFR